MSDSQADLDSLVATIREQEARLVFTTFTNDDAWALGSLLVAKARAAAAPVAIDIRRGDQQLFHAALPGTTPNNDEWIGRKVRTVMLFGQSSFLVGRAALASGTPFEAQPGIDHTRFAAHGGGFPVTVKGVGIVGTVAVSGLPQAEDHQMLVDTIGEFLGL